MRPDGPRDPIAGPDSGPQPPFPVRLEGQVIKGFGRGSKELGIPTANLPIEGLAVGGNQDLDSGVYYGWASLANYSSSADQSASHSLPPIKNSDHGEEPQPPAPVEQKHGEEADGSGPGVFPMVMSIGWNPYYKNTKRSVEVHIMHAFAKDFYGTNMKIAILGFIRPEYDYVSVDSLVEDIRTDIDVAAASLARKPYEEAKHEKWLVDFR